MINIILNHVTISPISAYDFFNFIFFNVGKVIHHNKLILNFSLNLQVYRQCLKKVSVKVSYILDNFKTRFKYESDQNRNFEQKKLFMF